MADLKPLLEVRFILVIFFMRWFFNAALLFFGGVSVSMIV